MVSSSKRQISTAYRHSLYPPLHCSLRRLIDFPEASSKSHAGCPSPAELAQENCRRRQTQSHSCSTLAPALHRWKV
jgi:hypothetical protein